GKERQTLTGHTAGVLRVAFAPDGKTLASTSFDGTMKLWDVTTGKHLRTFTGHRGAVYGPAFSPDGKTLATSGEDATVRLWDVARTPPRCNVLPLFPPGTPVLHGVAFSPEGRYLATANLDGTVYVLRLAKPGEVFQVPVEPAK